MAQTALAAYKAGQRAKGKKGKHRRGQTTIPLAALAGWAPLVANVIGGFRVGGAEKALDHLSAGMTGYSFQSGVWSPKYALYWGVGPIFLGAAVHKIAVRLGVNRMLAAAGVPWLRV